MAEARTYAAEFKEQAVKLAKDGMPPAEKRRRYYAALTAAA